MRFAIIVMFGMLVLAGCVDTIEQRCHREAGGDTICTSFRAQRLLTDPQIQGREHKSPAVTPEKKAPSTYSVAPTPKPSMFDSAWNTCQQQETRVTIQCLTSQGVQISRQNWEQCRILPEHKVSKQCVWNIVEPKLEAKVDPPLATIIVPEYRPTDVRKEKGFSTGTGFFVTDDGYLVTSYHVVEDTKEIVVKTTDRRLMNAKFISGDSVNDVALLKIEGSTKALSIFDSRDLLRGEEVFTLGYPLLQIQGQDQKATFGRINALRGIADDIRFLQVDVPIQPGNSGGPLIDTRGRVIGVVTATLNQLVALRLAGSLPQSVNYAVKSDYLIPLLRSTLKDRWNENKIEQKPRTMAELVKELEESVVLVVGR